MARTIESIIAAQGYQRTTEWEEVAAPYLIARIEPKDAQ